MGTDKLDFRNIKVASRLLPDKSQSQRDAFLLHLANELELRKGEILEANKADLRSAQETGKDFAFLQRLALSDQSIADMQFRLKKLKSYKFDAQAVLAKKRLLNGALLKKVRSSFGTIAVIYESRPEVAIDASALCIKSGNCAILKGGKEAQSTTQRLAQCIRTALIKADLSIYCVSCLEYAQHADIYWLIRQRKYIDLLIARGSHGLISDVEKRTKIPLLSHSEGGARIYVDSSADIALAIRVILNAKISKPAACNSLDTVVVHRKIAARLIPALVKALRAADVSLTGDRTSARYADLKHTATWSEETLSLRASIKVIKDIHQAVSFINRYGKKHSEGIIAENQRAIAYFLRSVDAAALFVNASPRLHDGFIFEKGAEMGIATGKIHARGPVGLEELCTYKWEIIGSGQIR